MGALIQQLLGENAPDDPGVPLLQPCGSCYSAPRRPDDVSSVYLEGGLTLVVGRYAVLQIHAPTIIAKDVPCCRGVEVAGYDGAKRALGR